MRPAIIGLSGTSIDADERALLRACPPAGIILFARNVATTDQLRSLTDDLHALLPKGAIVLVDQEGGRVARLRPPHWRGHPPAAALGRLHDPAHADQAAFCTGALIGLDCAAAGIDVVAAPVLDVLAVGADPIIGDRAFATDPHTVTRLGGHVIDGLLAAGIQPVGKHVPGHGRASVDSHASLPELDAPSAADLAPFAALAQSLAWLMTAHILYRDLDPDRPATLSPTIIDRLIRGELAFDGVLVTDDLAMGALAGNTRSPTGTQADRARAAIDAGCDLALCCDGDLATNAAILDALSTISERSSRRLRAAADLARRSRVPLDVDRLDAQREALLA